MISLRELRRNLIAAGCTLSVILLFAALWHLAGAPMSGRLSISAEQLRSIDRAALVLPVEARNRFKYDTLVELEIRCGQRAVSDTDMDRAIDRVLKMAPVPALSFCDAT